MTAKYVIFDFDGVIADSFALASAVAKRRCVHNSPEVYRGKFEGNIYDAEDTQGENHDQCEHDLDWWSEYKAGLREVKPFEDIVSVIVQLSDVYRLAIITSARAAVIAPFLSDLGLDRHFEDVLDVSIHTHKDVKIRKLLSLHDTNPDDCVMITDTLGDIREAKQAGVGSIACNWGGWHDSGTLQKGEPFVVLTTPLELPDAIDRYFDRNSR